MADSELLRMAATPERFSEHPLGRAIVSAAEEKGLALADPERFEVLPGLGVRVGGQDVVFGRPKLLVENGFAIPAAMESEPSKLGALGRTVILGAVDGSVAGLLVLEDAVRTEAKQLTEKLKRLGVRVVLVTGDNQATARRIADELGIPEIHVAEPGLLPRRVGDPRRPSHSGHPAPCHRRPSPRALLTAGERQLGPPDRAPGEGLLIEARKTSVCTFRNDGRVMVCDVAIGDVKDLLTADLGETIKYTPVDGQGTLLEAAAAIDVNRFEELVRTGIARSDAARRLPD
jgi:hypothetical protein